MALVFVTTIVFGALMPYAVKYFRTLDPPKEEDKELKEIKDSDDVCANQEQKDENENMNYDINYCHPNFMKE